MAHLNQRAYVVCARGNCCFVCSVLARAPFRGGRLHVVSSCLPWIMVVFNLAPHATVHARIDAICVLTNLVLVLMGADIVPYIW